MFYIEHNYSNSDDIKSNSSINRCHYFVYDELRTEEFYGKSIMMITEHRVCIIYSDDLLVRITSCCRTLIDTFGHLKLIAFNQV